MIHRLRLDYVMLAAVLLVGTNRYVAAQTTSLKKADCCCSQTVCNNKLVIRTYPVADLILQAHDAAQPKMLRVAKEEAAWCCTPVPGARPTCQGNIAAHGKELPAPVPNMDQGLVKLITHMVAGTSWEAVGGEGAIEYFPLGMQLVIRQTPAVHVQICELLATLRRFQELEVSVEVKLISLSESLFTRFREDLHTQVPCPSCTNNAYQPMGLAFLSDTEESQLLKFVQSDRRGSIMLTRKLTMFNGQAATIELPGQQFSWGAEFVEVNGQTVVVARDMPLSPRFNVSVRPAVSADRHWVRLDLKVSRTDSGNPALFPVTAVIEPVFEGGFRGAPVPFTQFFRQPTVEGLVNIPDGATVVLSGWTQMREVPNDPALAELPLIGWLFDKPVGQPELEHVLLMVTPRIIVTEQKEQRLARGNACSLQLVMPPAKLAQKTPCCTERLCEALRLTAGTCEEQECLPCPQKDTQTAIAATRKWDGQVAELLGKYEEACSKSQFQEAEAFARQALALDPACFSKKPGSAPQPSTIDDFEMFLEHVLEPPTRPARPKDRPQQFTPEQVHGGIK